MQEKKRKPEGVISECNQHDRIAVHLFQRKLLDVLTLEYGGKRPWKVYYMSDGCAAQYKNMLPS